MSSSPPSRRARQREAKSLELTQRVILSVIVAVVLGSFSAVLAAYWRFAAIRIFRISAS